MNTRVNNIINFINKKSSFRFSIAFFLLLFLRALEFTVDYTKGDKDGSISSPAGLLLNAFYLLLIITVAFNYTAISSKLNKNYVVLIIIFFISLISFPSINSAHSWGDDWALYIEQARAFNGNSIDKLKQDQVFLVENSSYILGPELYPWGYPFIIAQAYKIFGLDLKVFKIFTFVFFPLSLLVLYFLFKYELGENGILILALFAFSPVFYDYRNMIYSDIPSMFFQLLGLALIRNFVVKKVYFINQLISYTILGAILFCSYSIRTVGIILLPTLFFCQLFSLVVEHRFYFKSFIKENSMSFIAYAVFFSSLVLYSISFHYSDTSYLSHVTSNFHNTYYFLQSNIFFYLVLPSDFIGWQANGEGLALNANFVWGICFPFVIFGFYKRFKQDYLFVIYIVFIYLINIINPLTDGVRQYFPVLPLIIYFLIIGLDYLKNKFVNLNPAHMFVIPLIIIFFHSFIIEAATIKLRDNGSIEEGPYSKDNSEMMNFIVSNTSPDDKIIFYKPRAMRLLTGNSGFVVNTVSQITDGRADFLIIRKDGKNEKFPSISEIDKISTHLKIVYENNDFWMYKIISE